MGDAVKVAVMGQGYVGLPLAISATAAGLSVMGFDSSVEVVRRLKAGSSTTTDVADDVLARALDSGYVPTSQIGELKDCRTFVICVPTPLSEGGGPDLTAVHDAARTIASILKKDDLVVLESTSYPGTTEELLPILGASGLSSNDFHLAFSPERIDPGNRLFGLANTPKVVGGYSECCAEAARNFYSQFCDEVVLARGLKEAEMSKLIENTYRHVNIALVNELATMTAELEIDLRDAIRCASTKPFGFQAFWPGPGIGGHCIPIDPHYLQFRLQSQLGRTLTLVDAAHRVNSAMPRYVAHRVISSLRAKGSGLEGSKILLLGVTYKENIPDQRESVADEIAEVLFAHGAHVYYWDPFVESWNPNGRSTPRVQDLNADTVSDFAAVVLLQKHEALFPARWATNFSGVLFDTRGTLESAEQL